MNVKDLNSQYMKSHKLNAKRKLKLVGTFFSVIIIAIVVVFSKNNFKSSASTKTYFSTYKDIVKIEDHASYTATQGMSIYSGKAYYTKLNKDTNTVRIWMYNIPTNKKYLVYNGAGSSTDFDIGHANSLYVNSKYMYIATMMSNEQSIYRYNINYQNGRYYLSNKQAYYVYSHNKNNTKPISIAAIDYSSYLEAFLVKSGKHIYVGNFSNNVFKWTKHFSIDNNITVKGKTSTLKIDLAGYTHQGMFCKDNVLYLPFMNSNQKNQTMVVAYTLDKKLPTNSILKEKQTPFFRITSSVYGRLCEIEEIGCYNGQMYANVNATYTEGGNNDRIIRFNDFYF